MSTDHHRQVSDARARLADLIGAPDTDEGERAIASRRRRGTIGDAEVATQTGVTSIRLPFVVVLVLVAVATGVLINSIATRNSDRDFREKLQSELRESQATVASLREVTAELESWKQARIDADAEHVDLDNQTLEDAMLLMEDSRRLESAFLLYEIGTKFETDRLDDAQLIEAFVAQVRAFLDAERARISERDK